jgi:CheY-like chemotaxis protein
VSSPGRTTLPRTVVVVDDEPAVCRLLGMALSLPEFDVRAYGDARLALADLPTLRPDLIICDITMPGMDGHAFLEAVKGLGTLDETPFIFLSALQDDDAIVASFSRGACDFVTKPFHLERFVAKVRATLRLAERRRPDRVSGEVAEGGTLTLLRYCEERRLTGRLTVTSDGRSLWADFLGGELTVAGSDPHAGGDDPFDVLLGLERGAYTIEQRPLGSGPTGAPVEPGADVEATRARAAARAPAIPTGRLSRLDVRGERIEIQTEGSNLPDFRVTTVIARGGQVLRKVEQAWGHPLGRHEDEALARAQIDRQHEHALATLRELGERPGSGAVDPKLLACAVSFIADQVRVQLGGVMVAALLSRTHRVATGTRPALRAFRVAEQGRVTANGTREPGDLVEAAAHWTAEFLAASGEIVAKARTVPVRRVTQVLDAELERCGYYASVDRALERSARA